MKSMVLLSIAEVSEGLSSELSVESISLFSTALHVISLSPVTYGGKTPMEEGWTNIFGRIHGAMKAGVKRAAFRLAMLRQNEVFLMKSGGVEPTPQQEFEMGLKAYEWANKQISFISRMKGAKGPLRDDKGEPTRKLLALKIWGHNPEK